MGRNVKFPSPGDYKPSVPAVFCPAERVLDLYNQDSGDTAAKLAKKVRAWFGTQAHQLGWAGVRFVPAVQTNHGAGCVLWLPPRQVNIQVSVTQHTLVLQDQTDAGGDDDDAELGAAPGQVA